MVIKNELKNIEKVNTLIFDIDFTLAKLGSDEEILKDVLSKYDISYKDEYGKLFVDSIIRTGFSEKISYNKLVEEFSTLPFIGKISSNELVDSLFVEEIKRLNPYPNMREVIRKLYKDYEIHALTDWFFNLATKKIDKMNLAIDSVFSTEGFDSKRKLTTYKNLIEILKKDEEEVIMIGDSSNDVQTSIIGIQSILMDYNNQKTSERTLATAVVTTSTDLPKILKKV